MRRTGVLLVSLALGLAGVTGCSGGDDKYCGLLKEAESDKTLSAAELGKDPKALETVTAKLKEIEEAAPSEIEAEWKTMGEGMELAGQDPTKIDPAKAEQMGKDLDAALKTLEKDAKDRCGVDMSTT
jgi:hypothetical protein